MSNINLGLKDLFVEAEKIAGKDSKEFNTAERKEQENIAKNVKVIFEEFTDAIISGVDGWEHGSSSKQASIRPKGNNNNPFATSIWNFYKPSNIKEQDKSLLLVYILMDTEKKEIFASVGIHDRRNVKKYRQNIIDNNSIHDIYQYIIDKIKQIDFDKNKFEIKEDRKFVYKESLDDFDRIVLDFRQLVEKLIEIYRDTVKEFIFLEKDITTTSKEKIDNTTKAKTEITNDTKQNQPLNQILYGPPGTGKTYNTINKALEIIFESEKDKNRKIQYEYHKNKLDKTIEDLEKILLKDSHTKDERNDLKTAFEFYKDDKQGQIVFTTFHQSYGYEEFVEGIKAIPANSDGNESNEMIYDVVDGVFRKLVNNAKYIEAQNKSLSFDWTNGNIFKMSLGGKEVAGILDWCLENNYISMGWGNDIDFSSINTQNWEEFKKSTKSLYQNNETDRYTIQAMYAFKVWMKKNDLVFISSGNLKIVAIGQVVGEYEYRDSIDGIRYSQFRKVNWLFVDRAGIPVEKLLLKKLSQQTIYNLDKTYVKRDFFDSLFNENKMNEQKNYILIIDEINRGNISKIFGELITLIEPSKRIGAEEEIRVKLPYSGDSEEPFGVPQNLYIIGTMNTADRSIAPIDTALRRRFVFEEMAPNPDLLKDIKIKDGNNETDIKLDLLLEAINTRIEYLYDRDHTIGHAYLIDVKTLDDLRFAFKNKIIPLLAEYFYEDWENIDLVLNQNGFIISDKENQSYLSDKIKTRIQNKVTYKVSDENNWNEDNFKKIYNDKALDKQDEPTE